MLGLLRAAGDRLGGEGTGLLVVLDDADALPLAQVDLVGHLARHLGTEGHAVAFLMSGGHGLAARMARSARSSGGPGPLWLTRLLPLDDAEAAEAVVVPAVERGVDVDEDALALLCRAAGGAPLELQRLAFGAWSLSEARARVGLAGAERAVSLACAPPQRRAG
jgi:hypothetical protein